MRNHGLDILALSETRWTQSGKQRLAMGEMIV
jgi:hypothetical protein